MTNDPNSQYCSIPIFFKFVIFATVTCKLTYPKYHDILFPILLFVLLSFHLIHLKQVVFTQGISDIQIYFHISLRTSISKIRRPFLITCATAEISKSLGITIFFSLFNESLEKSILSVTLKPDFSIMELILAYVY